VSASSAYTRVWIAVIMVARLRPVFWEEGNAAEQARLSRRESGNETAGFGVDALGSQSGAREEGSTISVRDEFHSIPEADQKPGGAS